MSRNGKVDAVADAAAAEALEVFEQFASLGPGAQVQVSREPGQRYLEILPMEGLDPELLRDRYGGGTFSLRVRQDGKWLKGQPVRRVTVEGEPKTFPPGVPDAVPTEEDRLRARLDELTAAAAAPAPPTSDTMAMAMMTTLGGILTTVLKASMERRPETTAIEIVDLARKLGKDSRRDSEREAFDPVAALGVPLLEEIRLLRKQGATDPPKQITPAPSGPPPVPKTMQELADFVASWCAPHVARGASPALRAELLMEDLELSNPPLREAVAGLSAVPNVLDFWAKMCPAVAAHREWHGAFIDEVGELAGMDEAEPPEGAADDPGPAPDDPEGGPGDPEDGGGHGDPVESGGPV